MKRILIGSIVALITFAVVFYVLEYDRSFLQLAIGFLLFFFPFMFISSFKSAVPVFILVFSLALSIYVIFRHGYYDVLLGIILALVIGGSIFYFRVRPYKPFSSDKYKDMAKKDMEDK